MLRKEFDPALITPLRRDKGFIILALDAIRVVASVALLCFAFVACGYAMYAGVTLMPETFPNYVLFIIFFVALFFLGVTEGLHVAAVQVAYEDHHQYKLRYSRASEILEFQNKGRNFQHFLIGRQIVVVFSVFILGRLTTFNEFFVETNDTFTNVVMYTGLLGCVLVVQVGQLMPQIISASYPIQYLNIPGVNWIYFMCIGLEESGLAYAVWLLSWLVERTLSKYKKNWKKGDNNYVENVIDHKEKFGNVVDLAYDIKIKSLNYISQLRDDLGLDDGVCVVVGDDDDDIEEDEIDVNTPLKSQSNLSDESSREKTQIVYLYPTIADCAQKYRDANLDVPGFLLSPNDPNYIPPHLVALELLQKQCE